MYTHFENLVDPFPEATPAEPPRGLIAFCFHYSRPMLPWLIAMSFGAILIAGLELIFVSFIGDLVDWLTDADRASFWADNAFRLTVMGVIILVVFPLATLLQSLIFNQTVFGNFPMLVRWNAHRYVLRQSLDFFQNEFSGRVSQKVMQTAIAVREVVTRVCYVLVPAVVVFAGTLFLVGRADVWLALPIILWLFVYLSLLGYFFPRLQKASGDHADANANMTGRVVDSYTNIQTIKLFASAGRELDHARSAMDDFMGALHRQTRLTTQLVVALNTSNSILLVSVGVIAITAWQQESISLGEIAVATALTLRIRTLAEWLLWELAYLFESVGTIIDGSRTIAQPVAITDRPAAPELVVSRGEIRFEHARFHYGRPSKVIEDFSLTISPGEKIGIAGPSGAGKSTLVNLLLRLHDLEGGRISIDDQDVRTVTQQSLRRQIGMVTQDTSLLHRSVRENIRYGRPEASDAEIVEAARRAHADAFIRELVDTQGRKGYDAHVGERGAKISRGQQQRIAIARVILKDAPILILDEATSALDSEVEAAIQESLDQLIAGKTVLAIAHRLSTIAAMDRLVVLDRGRIVEVGRHNELLGRDGLYAQLWRHQSAGFIDTAAGRSAGVTPV